MRGLIEGGGLFEKGGLIEGGGLFEKGGLIEGGGLFEKGGLIEDLRYVPLYTTSPFIPFNVQLETFLYSTVKYHYC